MLLPPGGCRDPGGAAKSMNYRGLSKITRVHLKEARLHTAYTGRNLVSRGMLECNSVSFGEDSLRANTLTGGLPGVC